MARYRCSTKSWVATLCYSSTWTTYPPFSSSFRNWSTKWSSGSWNGTSGSRRISCSVPKSKIIFIEKVKSSLILGKYHQSVTATPPSPLLPTTTTNIRNLIALHKTIEKIIKIGKQTRYNVHFSPNWKVARVNLRSGIILFDNYAYKKRTDEAIRSYILSSEKGGL